MKRYAGVRDEKSKAVVRVIEGGTSRKLDPRTDLINHSPTGYEWGYGGSGPAQLALAMLCDALGDDKRAVRLHQKFKFKVIATFARWEPWEISQAGVLATAIRLEEADIAATSLTR